MLHVRHLWDQVQPRISTE